MTGPSRPEAGPPRTYVFPLADRQSLANGLTVISAPIRRLPVVTVLAIVDAGAERDAVAQSGLATLTAKSLGEGTRRLSGHQLAEAFERLGGEMSSDATWTRAECGITVMASRLHPTLQLIADVLREPALRDEDIERLRDERLAELLQIEAEPRELADDRFAHVVFGSSARDAQPVAGSRTTAASLTSDDVRMDYRKHYTPTRTTLIIAGDLDSREVGMITEDLFGDWSAGTTVSHAIGTVEPTPPGKVHIVPRPDAPQSEIRIGHRSVGRSHRDFHAIAVMNAILGGLFNSRINLSLRERHAFTYGAFSSFDWRRGTSAFEVSTAVRSDVTAAAVAEIVSEIDRIRNADVSDEELSLAMDYLTGVFPIRFETTAAIAEAIAVRESYGLEQDYYDTYRDRISSVSVAAVRDVAARILEPENLQILTVGDPEMIRGPLTSLGLGEPGEATRDSVHAASSEWAGETS